MMAAAPLTRAIDRVIVHLAHDVRADGLPLLDSRPAAPFKLYVDFDGDAATGHGAMSLDDDATTFSDAEQAAIVDGWQNLADFFAPFDVGVTTVQPDASQAFTWTLVGNDVVAASSLGTFHAAGATDPAPTAFNPTADLTGGLTNIVRQIGHNLGLADQIAPDAAGPNRAAVMAAGATGTVPAWTIGHSTTSGVTALQDDLAVLSATLARRADDHAGSADAATTLPLGGDVTGVIETLKDADAFTLTIAEAGRYDVAAIRDAYSSVALKLDVYDGDGKLLASADGETTDQSVRLTLDAGTYTVVVRSHGNYGEIGQYHVRATQVAPRSNWTFDEGADATAADVGRAGATANVNGATWTTDGRDGTAAVVFDGVDDAVTAGEAATIAGATDFTVGAWIRTTDADGGLIVAQHDAAGAIGYALALNADGTLRFTVAGGGATQFDVSTTFAVNDGLWHHVVAARAGARGQISIDGALAAAAVGTPVALDAATSVTIGGDATDGFLDGTIDDVRIDDAAATIYTGLEPTTLTAARGGIDVATNRPQIALAWTAVADATHYLILRSADGAAYAEIAGVDASQLNFVDTVADGARRYFYKVVALAEDGVTGSVSAAASAVSLPQAIANGHVTAAGSKVLVIDWLGGDSTGETAYRIERSTDGTTFVTLTDAHPANTPSYTATGLTASTTYWFRITPLDGADAGAPVVLSGTTLAPMPQVSGLHIVGRDQTGIAIAWTDAADEDGYRIERSFDGKLWETHATLPADATSFDDASLTPLTEYHYRVIAFNSTSESLPAAVFASTLPSTSLPEGWLSQDIGDVGAIGGTGFTGAGGDVAAGTWTSLASGADVGGTADAFHFTYRTLVGDGQIIARVTGLENTDGRARAGVMFRETLDADARHAMLSLTAGNGAEFASRATAGGATTTIATAGVAAPQWVKLVRRGAKLTGFTSVDGINWTQRGTVTLAGLEGAISVGLANLSADDAVFSAASFTDVSLPADAVDPTLTSTTVDAGTPQRSVVRRLTLTFDEPVTLLSGAVDVRRSGGATAVTYVATPSEDHKTYVITFAGTGVAFGSLDDGRYVFTLLGNRVADAAGNAVATNATTTFTRLFGDVDGDGDVDNADLFRFRVAQNSTAAATNYNAAVDYEGDGDVDNADLFQFRLRQNTTVPSTLLAGTPIGTAGSFQNAGNTIAKAFDGNLNTFFDGPVANGATVGLDFGAPRLIDEIRYAPRSGYAGRMVGGAFEGANNANFSDAVLLGSVATAPVVGSLTSIAVTNKTAFRYVRYRAPLNSSGNVAELQFIGYAPAVTTAPVDPTENEPSPPSGAPIVNAAAPAPVAVMTAVTGTGVIAGQAVHFDALASVLNVGSVTTARFEWNFGEPASAFNTLVGFNAAHVYDAPGTYKVTLRVINEAGKSATATTNVTVTAFGAPPAIYVSAEGDDANSGASADAPIRTYARAIALLGQRDRVQVLFRRGDTFEVANEMAVFGDDVTIAAYGTGDRPVLRWTGARTSSAIIAVRNDAADLVVRGLTFDSHFTSDFEQSGMPVALLIAGRNTLVRDNVFLNLGYATNIGGASVGTLVQGNAAPLATGIRGYFAWVEGTNSVILGNTAANSTREHIIRASGFNRMLVAHNDFANTDRRSVDPYDYDKSTVNVQKGRYAYVVGNQLAGQASFGPLGTTSSLYEKEVRTTYGVFENNHLTANLLKIGHGAEHVMIRNNVFDTDDEAQIDVQGYDATFGRGVVDLAILNNTGINDGTRGNFLRTYSPVDGMRLLNNLYVAPNLKVGAYDSGGVVVYDSSLRSFAAIDGNNWGRPFASNFAQGGVNLLGSGSVQSSYQTPDEWNALAGVGTDLFENLSLGANYKPTGPDAIVYGGTAVGGVFVDYAGNYRDPTKWAIGAA